jgi:ABC-type nitrate/sulfonate/bicarbonate transport system ATPase subunit
MATLELDEVSKINGDATVAVDHVRLDIEDCEFVVLGPSGCGTTTALAFADDRRARDHPSSSSCSARSRIDARSGIPYSDR